MGMSEASMPADDFLRGGVNGSLDIPYFTLRSSSLFPGTLKGGV